MAKSQPINYARVAEILTELGVITSETAQGVIGRFGDLAYGALKPGHEIAAIEALSPDDDPRSFRCVDSGPYTLGHDDVMVLATAEQGEGLTRHLGITFREPW